MMKVNIAALQSNRMDWECFGCLADGCKPSFLVLDRTSVIFFSLLHLMRFQVDSSSVKFRENGAVLLPCILTASNVGWIAESQTLNHTPLPVGPLPPSPEFH